MTNLLLGLFCLAVVFVGSVFIVASGELRKGDRVAYERNRKRTVAGKHGRWAGFFGTVDSRPNGVPDGTVCEGVGVDKRKNEWVAQAAISEEAIKSTFVRK